MVSGQKAAGAASPFASVPVIRHTFGELIDAGRACLLVIGESTIQSALEKAGLKPDRHVEKQVDASSRDVDAAVADTAKQLG